jgi:hypothetical protein
MQSAKVKRGRIYIYSNDYINNTFDIYSQGRNVWKGRFCGCGFKSWSLRGGGGGVESLHCVAAFNFIGYLASCNKLKTVNQPIPSPKAHISNRQPVILL